MERMERIESTESMVTNNEYILDISSGTKSSQIKMAIDAMDFAEFIDFIDSMSMDSKNCLESEKSVVSPVDCVKLPVESKTKYFDMNEIEPGLFLGSLIAAKNSVKLAEHGIDCILSVGMMIPNIIGLNDYDRFIITDEPDSDMSEFFDRGIEFIERNLTKNNKILVHCFAGVSRSATIVAAYLIKKYKIDTEQAISMIREKRYIIDPNRGFREQLNTFCKNILI